MRLFGAIRNSAEALPFWVHVMIGSVLLISVVPFVEPAEIWTSDEGAVRAQVEFVAGNGDWSRPRPFAGIDPESVLSPIKAATINGDRYSPYTKQPAFPLLLVPLQATFGESALIGLSLFGAIAAAVAGSMVIGVSSPKYRRTTFWALVFASPLLVYSFTVAAHTLAAACAGFAFVLAVRANRRATARGLGVAALVALAISLRAEGVIYGVALSIALIVLWNSKRNRHHLGMAAGVFATTIAAQLATSRWALEVGGSEPVSEGERILDVGRIVGGAFSSIVHVGWHGTIWTILAALLVVGSGVLLAFIVRNEPENHVLQLTMAGLCGLAVAALLLLPAVPVVGFLVATPLLAVGLTLIRWRELNQPTAKMAIVLVAAFALGIVLTQDSAGGGVQWGGRYLMPVIPLVVPAAIVAINRQLIRTPSSRTILVAVVVLMSVGMSTNGLLLLKHQHEAAVTLQTSVNVLADAAVDGSGAKPVIVATNTHLGRHMWRDIERMDLLLPPLNDFTMYLERFAATDVGRFGFVGDIEKYESFFASIGFRVETRIRVGYTVLERAETP